MVIQFVRGMKRLGKLGERRDLSVMIMIDSFFFSMKSELICDDYYSECILRYYSLTK